MSEFDNLNLFLKEQETLKSDSQNSSVDNIELARTDLEPLIQSSIRTLAEYYQEILLPRTDFAIVLKKKEQPSIDPNKLGQDHYTYVINFIPKNDLPYRDGSIFLDSYLQQNIIGPEDWHPNVALQFGIHIQDKYDQESKLTVGLRALLDIRVWGVVQTEKDINHEIASDLYLSYENGWDRHYSIFTIYGNEEQPEQTKEVIKTALTMATPNILTHRKQIRGY